MATRPCSALVLLLRVAALHAAQGFSEEEAFWHYAIASSAYCTGHIEPWDCIPCQRSNASISHVHTFYNSTTDMRAFLAVLRWGERPPRIVFSFRGTETLQNWIEDLKVFKTDRKMSCTDCRVHEGFVDVWDSLASQALPALASLRRDYPSAPLTITGHSLGGAVAFLSAYILTADLHIAVDAVYTYGSPRVGNKAFAEAHPLVKDGRSWRITHHRDVVPHLPPRGFYPFSSGFVHAAREVFYHNDSAVAFVCDGTGEDDRCSNQYLTPLSVHDHLSYYGIAVGEDGC